MEMLERMAEVISVLMGVQRGLTFPQLHRWVSGYALVEDDQAKVLLEGDLQQLEHIGLGLWRVLTPEGQTKYLVPPATLSRLLTRSVP